MRGPLWWSVVVLALAPMATAVHSHSIQVDAQLESLKVPGAASVGVRDALLLAMIDPANVDGAPLVRLEGGAVHVRQFWLNSTLVVEPTTGNILYRWSDPWASQDIALEPDRIQLLQPMDRPDVRMRVHSPFGVEFGQARETQLVSGRSPELLGPSRASAVIGNDVLAPYDAPPADSGWAALRPASAQGVGNVDYLIDGWEVRLGRGDQVLDLHTGIHTEFLHGFGQGGHAHESYSVLEITALGALHTYGPALQGVEGFAADPTVAWEGPASLRLHDARLGIGQRIVPLDGPELRLDGRFEAFTRFHETLGATPFHATGTGTTDAVLPADLATTVPFSQQASAWTSVAVALAALVLLGAQTLRARRRASLVVAATPPPAAPPSSPHLSTLEQTIERAQKAPLDADAQFDLGVALMRHGASSVGIRALDRSFRLQPGAIVKLLEDPDLASVRDHADVRLLLGRFQREQHRKVWAGYA